MSRVYEEKLAQMQAIYDSKIEEFKAALKERCESEGIPLQIRQHGDREIFILGHEVYGIQVTDDHIGWDCLGVMR